MNNCSEDGSHHDAERSLVSRDGAVVRALASHQSGLGSMPAQNPLWVEFVGSHLVPRVFLRGTLVFLSLKTYTANSNSTRIEDLHENKLRLMWLPL